MQSALAIVSICGIAALVIGVLVGSLPLMTTLVGSAVLSLAYSVDLPFLRWKQNPVAAAACILAVRYFVLPALDVVDERDIRMSSVIFMKRASLQVMSLGKMVTSNTA